MSDNWKVSRWMEDMTPRRAIQNFFDHATPVDSPDPEELVKPQDDAHDGTPLASQSSQPGVALKRKILDNGPEDNPAKKPSQQESGLLDEDNSILGLSELPSQLGSPSIEPLARPKVASRRKVSTSTFSQVIQSQESQTKKIDETKSLDDESFPSALGSPDAVISQRPGKKSRISISTFSKTIEARKVMEKSVTKSSTATEDLSHESTDIPISLESPVINYRPGPKSSKKRVSSTSFQDTLQDKRSNASNSAQPSSAEHVSVNTTVPDTLDSPTNMPTDRRLLNKQRKKISLTAFSQVIEKRTDSVPVKPTRTSESGSSYSSTPKNQTSDQYISEDDSPEIKEIESPQEIYSSREPSVHVTEFQSQQAPTTTKVVEETVVGNRSSPNDVEDFEHYLSLSDDDINNQPNSKNKIAEFTALQVQQPSAQERRSPTGNSDPKGSRSTRSNSKIAVMEEVFGASDDDELKFTADTSIAFKRTYSHPKDKTATMETLENLVGIPDIGSPEDFAPTASSTQLVKRKPPAPVDQTVMEELLSENQRSIPKKKLSQTPAKTDRPEKDDGMSTSDIPSKLNSPEEVKRDRHRPGPASSKKRVSMTQFMAALDQRSVVPPQFETPQKPSSAPQTTPVLVSEVVLQPPIESVTESLQVSKVLPRRSLRASTSSSTTVPRQDPVSASEHDSDLTSDEEEVEPIRISKTPAKRTLTASTASSATVSRDDIVSERNSDPSLVDEKNESLTELDSPPDFILQPTEPNKTSQTLVSIGRSRKSLIFDSIDTTPDITPAEESLTSNSLRAATPNVEAPDRVPSPVAVTNQTSEALPSEGRSRKSLRFESLVATRDITPEEMSPSGTLRQTRSNEETVEETPSVENIEQEVEFPEIPEEESAQRGSTEDDRLSRSSRKSEKTGLSPFNRYPGLKNSTVVAGGAPFMDVSPLSISPIVSRDKDSLPSVPATPTTPAQLQKKPSRSIAHSPMYLSVMQKAFKNQESRKISSATPLSRTEKTPVASKPADKSLRKGTSLSNTLKGKSIALSIVSEDHETSEIEDDEPVENIPIKPIPIEVAFERQTLPDRSKSYIPLEKRLREDATFQAKVNVQKAKIEAAKVAEQAAAARSKTVTRKPRTTAAKKMADNITNVVTNKGNLRFYAKFKVAKDAMEAAHEVVSEWFDFTLDQMETFCDEEGIALDSWENCYKMLKRQNIVKNEAEYAGLCHDLLLNDEAQDLLPSEFPAGHYESKRQAKRRRML